MSIPVNLPPNAIKPALALSLCLYGAVAWGTYQLMHHKPETNLTALDLGAATIDLDLGQFVADPIDQPQPEPPAPEPKPVSEPEPEPIPEPEPQVTPEPEPTPVAAPVPQVKPKERPPRKEHHHQRTEHRPEQRAVMG